MLSETVSESGVDEGEGTPRRSPLERPHIRLELINELAKDELTQTALAERYGVTPTAITFFKKRHQPTIDKVRANAEDKFAALWVADKVNRIGVYQQQIDDITEMLEDPAKAIRAGVGHAEMVRTAQSALKAVAEELGQLPGRMTVAMTGSVVHYNIAGVNMDDLK